MNKLTITIDTKNDAFGEDGNLETVRILERIAFMLKNDYALPGIIRDINGNDVGTIKTK